MHEPTPGTIEAGMNAKGLTSSEGAVPIITDIRPRSGARAPSELVGGVPSRHLGPNRNPEGSVANGVR
jgi:hypothetical protein